MSLSLAFGKHPAIHLDPPPLLELNHSSVPLDAAVLAFVIVQVRLVKSINPGVDVPSILNTVSRDAGVYFAVISTSHALTLIMYSVSGARVGFFTIAQV